MNALIYSKKQSNWVSCQVITKNLIESWQETEIEFKHFDLDNQMYQYEIENLAKNIVKVKPQKIIFCDHNPNPCTLILELEKVGISKDVEFIFHIYGDFILPSPSLWLNTLKSFKDRSVKFICASDRQVNYIKQFITESEAVFKSPFPVNKSHFSPSNIDKTNALKKSLGIPQEMLILGYVGRISQQKRFIELIDIIFNKLENQNFHFCFCGFIDSIGQPYAGHHQQEGELFQEFNQLLKTLDSQQRERIHFLGNLENTKLHEVYNLIDININIGTYNDEDFGMATAEALMCGTPSVLSDWGGLSSFAQINNNLVPLVKVDFNNGELHVDEKQVIEAINKVETFEIDRKKLAEQAEKYLSIKNVSENLRAVYDNDAILFNDFSPLFLKLCQNSKERPYPFKKADKKLNDLYEEVYECYYK